MLPPEMWKLILKKVHWPYTVSETLLIVLIWTGIQVVGEFGIKTACLFESTKILPYCKSLGYSFVDLKAWISSIFLTFF